MVSDDEMIYFDLNKYIAFVTSATSDGRLFKGLLVELYQNRSVQSFFLPAFAAVAADDDGPITLVVAAAVAVVGIVFCEDVGDEPASSRLVSCVEFSLRLILIRIAGVVLDD